MKQIGTSLTVLLVADLDASRTYYRDVLGFNVTDWWAERDGLNGLAVKLEQAASPADVRPNRPPKGSDRAIDIYAYVTDWRALDALYDEFRAKGVTIAWEPWIAPDGGPWKEFAIRDLNGYCIAFGGVEKPF